MSRSDEIISISEDKFCRADNLGNKFWYYKGRYHREDGPAIEYADGTNIWLINGIHHRTDGAAIESHDEICWCFKGSVYSKEEWFNLLTIEEKDNYIWNMNG